LEGRLDESIGEALAAWVYNLQLRRKFPGASRAVTEEGIEIQLKVTRSTKGTIGIWQTPTFLLVLQLSGNDLAELYNGPTCNVWDSAGKLRSNGQRRIPVSRLRTLALDAPEKLRLHCKRNRDWAPGSERCLAEFESSLAIPEEWKWQVGNPGQGERDSGMIPNGIPG